MWNLQKALSLCTNKICRFEIIDGVKYVYCIKHAYKFLLKEQVGFAAVLWRLRQCVSCISYVTGINYKIQGWKIIFACWYLFLKRGQGLKKDEKYLFQIITRDYLIVVCSLNEYLNTMLWIFYNNLDNYHSSWFLLISEPSLPRERNISRENKLGRSVTSQQEVVYAERYT